MLARHAGVALVAFVGHVHCIDGVWNRVRDDERGHQQQRREDGALPASAHVPTPPYCVLTATWLADLDRLERAFPGKVIGKPLCVELTARDFAAAPVPINQVTVTLSAVMLRK